MSRAPRLPVDELLAGLHELPTAAGHHVAHVLRRRRGDSLRLFEPRLGLEADAVVVSVDGARVVVEVQPPREAPAGREFTIVHALGKGDKMDAIVRDATELGVARIVPVTTARTVVRPGDRASARVERWRRIADEAARQCGRALAPSVDDITPLADVRALSAALRLVLVPHAPRPAGSLLLEATSSVAFVVGPEGGLDDAEITSLAEAGWEPASLGPNVLRTETVAAAVLGALLLTADATAAHRDR